MKPLFLFFSLFFLQACFSQNLDYITIRKNNGRVVKNFYAGSDITLQTTDELYLQGPVKAVQNDTVYLILYDIRYLPTTYGGFVRDTLTTTVMGIHYKDIKRIQLNDRQSFYQRSGPALLILAGGGYLALNVLNGAFYNQSVSGSDRLRRIGIGGALFGLGYLLQRLFHSDGFSKPSQQIVYVNLSPKKA